MIGYNKHTFIFFFRTALTQGNDYLKYVKVKAKEHKCTSYDQCLE